MPAEHAPLLEDFTQSWIYERSPELIHPAEAALIVDFIDAIKYLPSDDRVFVWEALDTAMYLHDGQTRKSEEKEPYSTHVIIVGTLLAKMKLGANQIAAGVLHDTVEDCSNGNRGSLISQLRERFGDRVVEPILLETTLQDLVKQLAGGDAEAIVRQEYKSLGMRRDTSLKLKAQINELCTLKLLKMIIVSEESETNQPKKTLSDTEQDIITAILIKLCDRLHNMRTLDALTPENQELNARETYDVHVKLAKRMGFWDIANELADLSMYYLNPKQRGLLERYQHISDSYKKHRPQYYEFIKIFIPKSIQGGRFSSRVLVPNAAAMLEEGKPYLTLNIGIPPKNPGRHKPTSNNVELRLALEALYTHIRKLFNGRKSIHLSEIDAVMAQINKNILHTATVSVPIHNPDMPGITRLRINIMSQQTFEEEELSLQPLLDHFTNLSSEKTDGYMTALRKWRQIQEHFREYKRMYKNIFPQFSSKEMLLALTQRVPVGRMLIIGSPPPDAGHQKKSRPQLPRLVKRGSTIRDFIADIVTLKDLEISEVFVNGMRATNLDIRLLPFDMVTVHPAKKS